jgi:hypothetical protein
MTGQRREIQVLRLGPPLIALALATAAWAVVASFFVDALDTGRTESAPTRAAPPAEDPCALREPLPTGTEARCTFELARPGAVPFVVDLDQRWQGNALMQWLNVRPSGSSDAVHFVYAQSTGGGATRLVRLFPLRTSSGEDHLVYLLGRCGGVTCPTSDLVVVGDDGGKARTLLSLRLGALADAMVRGDTLTAIEAWFPQGAQRPGGMVARRFAWDGAAYAMGELLMLPAPTPTQTPR